MRIHVYGRAYYVVRMQEEGLLAPVTGPSRFAEHIGLQLIMLPNHECELGGVRVPDVVDKVESMTVLVSWMGPSLTRGTNSGWSLRQGSLVGASKSETTVGQGLCFKLE